MAGINRYEWRYIDRIIFKGFTKHKQTIEIFGYKGEVDQNTMKLISLFHKALDLYYQRRWDEAIKIFKNCLKYETIDHYENLNPSTIFLKRCKEYIVKEPSDVWDGVINLEEK